MRSTVLLTAALPSALAVSLADFAPRASNLPPSCQSVYISNIDMCQPSDFQTQQCAEQCILALNALRTSIGKACQGVTGHNILVAFMSGQGTQDLCPNWASVGGGTGYPPPVGLAPAPPGPASPSSPPPPPQTYPPQTSSPDQDSPTAAPASNSPQSDPPPSTTTTTTTTSTDSPSTSDSPTSAPSKGTATTTTTSTGRTTYAVVTNTVMPVASDTNVGTSIVADTNAPLGVATRTTSGSSAQATNVNGGGSPFDAGMGGMHSDAGMTRPVTWTVAALVVLGGLMVAI